MNYLTKNRGINDQGMKRIAKEVGVPARKRSQDLSEEVQRWADVILDAIYDTLESVPSDVPSDMVLRTVYDSLAIHAIPSLTKNKASKKPHRRLKALKKTAEAYTLNLSDEDMDALAHIADRYEYAAILYDALQPANEMGGYSLDEPDAWAFQEAVEQEDGYLPLMGGSLLEEVEKLLGEIV